MNSLTLHHNARHVSQKAIDRFIGRLRPGSIDVLHWMLFAKLSLDHLGLDRCRKSLVFSAGQPADRFLM